MMNRTKRGESGGADEKIAEMRNRLANGILVVGSFAAIPTVGLSLSRVVEIGWQVAHSVQVLGVLVLFGVTLARKRLPYPIRALFVPVFLMVAGIVGVINFGLLGAGFGLMGVSAMLATIVMSRRAGVIFTILALVAAIGVMGTHQSGLLSVGVDVDAYLESNRAWLTRIVAMLMMAALIIGPIGYLSRSLFRLVHDLEAREQELQASNAEKDAAIAELTDLKQSLEKRVSDQTAGLQRAKEQAEAANRAKTDFLNIVSHELRTPLTVVLGYSKMLAKADVLPPVAALRAKLSGAGEPATPADLDAAFDRVRDLGAKMDRSGEHLLQLINDLLDFAKIEAGKMDLSRSDVSLHTLVKDVLHQLKDAASEKALTMTVDLPSEDVIVHADELRVRQVLINLVGNAVKFTPEGAVTISVRDGHAFAECRVRDTGPGIPGDQADAIFDTFHQLEDSLTRAAGGTGLGLAITKKLVIAHGGEVHARNHPEGGAEFVFTLPKE